jgi:hypothetical protein
MTNLIHTCFILQFVYYKPQHVSSIICSSSGGFNCIDSASGIVTLSKWPSGAQVERERSCLSTCAPLSTWMLGVFLDGKRCCEIFKIKMFIVRTELCFIRMIQSRMLNSGVHSSSSGEGTTGLQLYHHNPRRHYTKLQHQLPSTRKWTIPVYIISHKFHCAGA